MGNVAIHGFGRIGRCTLRVALEQQHFVPTVISDVGDPALLAALFEVDTNYGRWPEPVSARGDGFLIEDRAIRYVDASQGTPDWGALGVDLVIDCTGRATTRAGAQAHLDKGAKRVLISAPSKSLQDCDAVLLAGINLDDFDPDRHRIVSMGSCTTNALAPVVRVIRERWGLRHGFFSTVHAYTNTQSLTDQPKKDRRDSWAAAQNVIPSSSGAAKTLKFVWPDLNVTGKAYRVPVGVGSIVELVAVLGEPADADAVKDAFREAASTPPLAGILGVLEDEWASSRIVGESHSSMVDLPLVDVIGGDLLSVAAWYDNEMGFSNRLAETARRLSG